MNVELTPTEIIEAGMCGVLRMVRVLQEGRGETHGSKQDEAWGRHVEGAMGERAVAKAFNIYWHGAGVMFGTDVGQETEVRTTKHDTGRLIIHKDDHDEKRYYLVTGSMGHYVVRGWIMGCDAKKQEYWDDPQGGRAAYFVPQHALQIAA